MSGLTAPQLKALTILASPREGAFVTPREVEHPMSQDVTDWAKRSRRFATAVGGALGATMPMKGATMLWKLRDRGLAQLDGTNHWQITEKGQRVLTESTTAAGEQRG